MKPLKKKGKKFKVELKTTFQIPYDEISYELDEKNERVVLGAGSYGTVYLGTFDGHPVAVKQTHSLKDHDGYGEMLKREMIMETEHYACLRNPNIVQFFGYTIDSMGVISVITKYVEGGSLDRLLRECRKGKKKISLTKKLVIALDIARGVRHLHRKNIINRDVKPKNVLVNLKLRAVVCDFGLSRIAGHTTNGNVGTPLFVAPEILEAAANEKNAVHTFASDVYSFGVTFHSIISEKITTEYPLKNFLVVFEEGDLVMMEIVHLMRRCCNVDPSQRCNFDDIIHTLEAILYRNTPQDFSPLTPESSKKLNDLRVYVTNASVLLDKKNKRIALMEKENLKFKMMEKRKKKDSFELETLRFERLMMSSRISDYSVIKILGGKGITNIPGRANAIVKLVEFEKRTLVMQLQFFSKNKERSFKDLRERELKDRNFFNKIPLHPNILRVHHSFIEEVDLNLDSPSVEFSSSITFASVLISPICDGSLKKLIKKAKKKNSFPVLDDSSFLRFLSDIVDGLVVLSELKYVHSNLKPDKVLLIKDKDNNPTYVFSGFASYFSLEKYLKFKFPFSQELYDKLMSKRKICPPEIVDLDRDSRKAMRFKKFDVFSLGIMCYGLFSLEGALKKDDDGKWHYRELLEFECNNKNIRKIIGCMCDWDYESRISIKKLKKCLPYRGVLQWPD